MIEHRYGSIVNVASIHSSLTTAGMFPYAAAKSGLVGMTRSLALDVAPHNVRVNAVSPGYIGTNLLEEFFDIIPGEREKALSVYPFCRIGTPENVAEAICFLASEAAAYCAEHFGDFQSVWPRRRLASSWRIARSCCRTATGSSSASSSTPVAAIASY